MGSHHPIRKFVAPEPVAIPDKLYFRIGDVARLCQVPAYVLRFWETEFPNLKPNKGGTGQRLYRRKDVEMALRIKTLLYDEGYTIPGARQVFKTEAKPREAAAFPPSDASNATGLSSQASNPGAPSSPTVSSPPKVGSQGVQGPSLLGNRDAAAIPDLGEAIRRRAQQEPRLLALRDDLLSLLTQLGRPTTRQSVDAPAAATSAAPKPARPRLVLEARPEPKPAAPKHESNLHVAQGDLFSSE